MWGDLWRSMAGMPPWGFTTAHRQLAPRPAPRPRSAPTACSPHGLLRALDPHPPPARPRPGLLRVLDPRPRPARPTACSASSIIAGWSEDTPMTAASTTAIRVLDPRPRSSPTACSPHGLLRVLDPRPSLARQLAAIRLPMFARCLPLSRRTRPLDSRLPFTISRPRRALDPRPNREESNPLRHKGKNVCPFFARFARNRAHLGAFPTFSARPRKKP
jgi:hypothetical protein